MADRQETRIKPEAEGSLDLMQQAEQRAMAGQLALDLMHEIRDPLETLGYLVYLALEEAADAQKVRKYMRMAEEELVRMSSIAQHTLGLARVPGVAAPVDLVELAETALRIHQRRIDGKRIQLNRRFPSQQMVHAQHGPLLQVVSNLIVNALEAMGEAGSLSVRVRKRKDEVDLIVADNGHGIPEQHLPHVGERYFTTKGNGGNGLGLALAKRIVDQHRGRMRVRSSVRPGRSGTVFKVSLPIGGAPRRSAESEAR